MSGYTRGPWRDYEVDAFGDHTITQNDGGLAIAAVVTNLRKAGEVSANARLIATAPELLHAAKMAIEDHEALGWKLSVYTIETLRKAIDKAEGGS